ncbi:MULTISPECIES: hypothetical protein [unclassified Microcoleus]|uniref:hypothetical protein n=1 Tax=unclassified Microcoleus TaxID=2642155 RepID=UPI001D3CD993|nr:MULTISPECIES: hypothetical protein [unclassified Microcoleus]MCC3464544.1 hypothetical protein [Microcoleus sp. PH2017_06_SFM_O_A]MCC3410551.1 hypothetical protein [Microcoleus sp. PH2017_02_FOX_O_A]MCC3455778.1 hypothetical protein [Microcoleus sp. PH2017_08_TRC_O_A]MCC3584301.1 hypothetical protein [Microcoleus sp. PH2017_30_WIL_O_A]MCC3590552.1 hypothetical protein [Microcoleus sp. PH2017_28_MFU_U_A]
MAFYKVRVQRESNTPRHLNVVASKSQEALQVAVLQLRDEGITDAKGVEVIGQVQSLRG